MNTIALREFENVAATEMNVAASLIHFDGVLRGLHLNRRHEDKSVMVPVAMLKEMSAFLLHYRAAIESTHGTLKAAHFKTIAERNAALDAYQSVCQSAGSLLRQVENAAE